LVELARRVGLLQLVLPASSVVVAGVDGVDSADVLLVELGLILNFHHCIGVVLSTGVARVFA